jgi:hypothetical protein
MSEFVKKWFAKLIVHIAGIRFYSTEFIPIKKDIQQFVVKTLHGYEIRFSFFREDMDFLQYIFGKIRKRKAIVYIVTANFEDRAPEEIKQYNTVRIFVNNRALALIGEYAITHSLLNVYLDFILAELIEIEKKQGR